jgi:hypothetical protein
MSGSRTASAIAGCVGAQHSGRNGAATIACGTLIRVETGDAIAGVTRRARAYHHTTTGSSAITPLSEAFSAYHRSGCLQCWCTRPAAAWSSRRCPRRTRSRHCRSRRFQCSRRDTHLKTSRHATMTQKARRKASRRARRTTAEVAGEVGAKDWRIRTAATIGSGTFIDVHARGVRLSVARGA